MVLHTLSCFNHHTVLDFPSIWISCFWPGPSLCRGPQCLRHVQGDASRSTAAAPPSHIAILLGGLKQHSKAEGKPHCCQTLLQRQQAGHHGSCPHARQSGQLRQGPGLCLPLGSLCPRPASPPRVSPSEAAFGDWPG